MGLSRPYRAWDCRSGLKDRVDVKRDALSASPSRCQCTIPSSQFPLGNIPEEVGERDREKVEKVCCVCVCVVCICVSSRITAGSLLIATCNFAFSRNADSLSIRRDLSFRFPKARNMDPLSLSISLSLCVSGLPSGLLPSRLRPLTPISSTHHLPHSIGRIYRDVKLRLLLKESCTGTRLARLTHYTATA